MLSVTQIYLIRVSGISGMAASVTGALGIILGNPYTVHETLLCVVLFAVSVLLCLIGWDRFLDPRKQED